MNLDQYQPYWNEVSEPMLAKMRELHEKLGTLLPAKFSITPPVECTAADEFYISMDIRHADDASVAIIGLDFKLTDGDLRDGEGLGILLDLTGYSGIVMGGYAPDNYTPDVFTDDVMELVQRVDDLPVDELAAYCIEALENPYLVEALRNDGITL